MTILALRIAHYCRGRRVLSVYPQSRTFSSLKGSSGDVGEITNKITPQGKYFELKSSDNNRAGNPSEVEENTSKIPLNQRNSTEALLAEMNEMRRQMSMVMTNSEGVSKANKDVMAKLEEVSNANKHVMAKFEEVSKGNERVITKVKERIGANVTFIGLVISTGMIGLIIVHNAVISSK